MNPNDPQLYDTLAWMRDQHDAEQIGAELAGLMAERPDLDLAEIVNLTVALDGDLAAAVAAVDDRSPAPRQEPQAPMDPDAYRASWEQLRPAEVSIEQAMAEEAPPKQHRSLNDAINAFRRAAASSPRQVTLQPTTRTPKGVNTHARRISRGHVANPPAPSCPGS